MTTDKEIRCFSCGTIQKTDEGMQIYPYWVCSQKCLDHARSKGFLK